MTCNEIWLELLPFYISGTIHFWCVETRILVGKNTEVNKQITVSGVNKYVKPVIWIILVLSLFGRRGDRQQCEHLSGFCISIRIIQRYFYCLLGCNWVWNNNKEVVTAVTVVQPRNSFRMNRLSNHILWTFTIISWLLSQSKLPIEWLLQYSNSFSCWEKFVWAITH